MRIHLSGRWLVGLTLLALAGCGNKSEEKKGAVQPAVQPSVQAVTVPSPGGSLSGGATQGERKVVILPESPTAQDPLMAVFQGAEGRVVYRWERDGQRLEGEERDRLAATYLKKGATITVVVENAGRQFTESITIGNIPPVVNQVTFKNAAIHRGVDIELLPIGDDADGDSVTFHYKWFQNGSQLSSIDGSKLPGNQFNRGDLISFEVIPFDGTSDGIPYVGVPVTIPDAPPLFVSTPPLQFLSETYSYQARAEDPDGDSVTYRLDNPPPGMKIDRLTGAIDWPLAGLPAGTYRINIVAEDSQGQKNFQEYSLTMVRQ